MVSKRLTGTTAFHPSHAKARRANAFRDHKTCNDVIETTAIIYAIACGFSAVDRVKCAAKIINKKLTAGMKMPGGRESTRHIIKYEMGLVRRA